MINVIPTVEKNLNENINLNFSHVLLIEHLIEKCDTYGFSYISIQYKPSIVYNLSEKAQNMYEYVFDKTCFYIVVYDQKYINPIIYICSKCAQDIMMVGLIHT